MFKHKITRQLRVSQQEISITRKALNFFPNLWEITDTFFCDKNKRDIRRNKCDFKVCQILNHYFLFNASHIKKYASFMHDKSLSTKKLFRDFFKNPSKSLINWKNFSRNSHAKIEKFSPISCITTVQRTFQGLISLVFFYRIDINVWEIENKLAAKLKGKENCCWKVMKKSKSFNQKVFLSFNVIITKVCCESRNETYFIKLIKCFERSLTTKWNCLFGKGINSI